MRRNLRAIYRPRRDNPACVIGVFYTSPQASLSSSRAEPSIESGRIARAGDDTWNDRDLTVRSLNSELHGDFPVVNSNWRNPVSE